MPQMMFVRPVLCRLLVALMLIMASAGRAHTTDSLDQISVQPGTDWSQYTGIYVEPATVEYSSRFNPRRPGSNLRYSHEELEEMKQRIAGYFMETFTRHLAEQGLHVTGEPGPDVLTLAPHLADVYVFAPETPSVTQDTLTEYVGHLTLEAKIADSDSGEVLATVRDKATGRDLRGEYRQAPPGYAEIELRRIFRDWGKAVGELIATSPAHPE